MFTDPSLGQTDRCSLYAKLPSYLAISFPVETTGYSSVAQLRQKRVSRWREINCVDYISYQVIKQPRTAKRIW
jgi:hypothetical protein